MVAAWFCPNFLHGICLLGPFDGFCGKTESIFITGSEIYDLDPEGRVVGTGDASAPKYSPLLVK
jgi:hypothetical protein